MEDFLAKAAGERKKADHGAVKGAGTF